MEVPIKCKRRSLIYSVVLDVDGLFCHAGILSHIHSLTVVVGTKGTNGALVTLRHLTPGLAGFIDYPDLAKSIEKPGILLLEERLVYVLAQLLVVRLIDVSSFQRVLEHNQ